MHVLHMVDNYNYGTETYTIPLFVIVVVVGNRLAWQTSPKK